MKTVAPIASPKIRAFLLMKGAAPPDLMFDAVLLDRTAARELSQDCPLHERAATGQRLPGCYAFVEEGLIGQAPEVIYVGKAVRLRNRLAAHWNRYSAPLDAWNALNEARAGDPDERPHCIYAVVWFTDSRAVLECWRSRRTALFWTTRLWA